MAPASHTRRSLLLASLVLILAATIRPGIAHAAATADVPAIPDLTTFAASVMNGNADVLRGIHVAGVFAYPVIQQTYKMEVSETPDTLTQFGWAARYGVTGILAHNRLSGADFFRLREGQEINLVYGDGHTEHYWVTTVLRYQATIPESPNSQFIDLETGKGTDAEGLFRKVYMGTDQVTFQTCIRKGTEWSWGRLFVIAQPFPPPPAAPPAERVALNTMP